jgi:hypothetical protein
VLFTDKASSIGVKCSIGRIGSNILIKEPISFLLGLEFLIMHENKVNFSFQISNLFLLESSLPVSRYVTGNSQSLMLIMARWVALRL